jgi:hypothetical protein
MKTSLMKAITTLDIHVYRTEDVSYESFTELLEGANAPLQYLKFIEGAYVSIGDLTALVHDARNREGRISNEAAFRVMQEVRKRADLRPENPLFLLSTVRNDANWFSFGEMPGNHYIHTADWPLFVQCEFTLPVSFLLGSNLLMQGMYDSLEELEAVAHHSPRGCIMDFCQEKHEIHLKMRTADACPDCMKRIGQRIKSGHLNAFAVKECFALMERVRGDLVYRNRFGLDDAPSSIRVEGFNQQVDVVGYGKRVKMSPIQRALYLFFLRRPDGVKILDLPDAGNIKELTELYMSMSNLDNRDEQAMIMPPVAADMDGRLREHLSKIRKAFKEIVGEVDAKKYSINGTPGEAFVISLDRQLVNWHDKQGQPVVMLREST